MSTIGSATLSVGLAVIDHFGLEGSYSEINPNVELSVDRFRFGAYHNSLGDTSLFAGYSVYEGYFDLDLGFVTGYLDYPVPFFRLEKDLSDNVSFFILPAIEEGSETRLGVVVGLNFKTTLLRF